MINLMAADPIRCQRSVKLRAWVVFLFTAVFALPFLTWETSSAKAKEPISVTGITEPIRDVELSATVAGTIAAVFMGEGMVIKKGDVILELDKKMEAFEVERRRIIWEGKAELDAAKAKVSTLKSLLEATRELFERTGSVSKEELDKLALDYELAVAEKRQLENAEERERIEYEMAKESLHRRSLISPVQGTIIKLFLDLGETCEENQPLAHVVDTSKGRFVCNVEEWIGRTLRKGQIVNLKIKTGMKSVARKGTIVFVSPVVDPASGLLEVKAEFDNRDGKVRPGISGTMHLKAP
jgi:RND family efflux transporter MFP subunit